MKPNCTELAAQYERGEITFDQFMNTATRQEPYTVPQTKRRGRRLAQRQGQLVTPAAPEPRSYSKVQEGEPAFEHIKGARAAGVWACDSVDHNEPNGCSNPDCFKHPEAKKDWKAPEVSAPLSSYEAADAYDAGGGETPQQTPLAAEDGPLVAAPGNLRTAEAALAFITAGNAYFTIRSQKTGQRYTYRVSRAKPNAGYCQWCKAEPCRCVPPYFVSLLSGPENTSDYTYLGMIRDRVFRLTRASKMNETSGPVRAFRWVYERLVRRELPPQTEIWHEGRCGRCGRMLTVPESVAAGIGPECAGKLGV